MALGTMECLWTIFDSPINNVKTTTQNKVSKHFLVTLCIVFGLGELLDSIINSVKVKNVNKIQWHMILYTILQLWVAFG